MATMYPEEFPGTGTSEAERRVFQALRTGLGPDFTVLAQFGWLSPDSSGQPREGEADLVVVHPDWGVLTLEVKGGVVAADGRSGWSSNGQPITNPVAQAQRARHELERRLQRAPGTRGFYYPFGYGVWFPDVDAARLPPRPDAPDEIILDASAVESPALAIEGLYNYWLPEEMPPGPGAAGVDALVQLLAPTWSLRPLLGPSISRERAEQDRLTEEQYVILQGLGRRRRALIAGCAGSGKTMLAMEKARRLALDGFTVLFTCFNKSLAGFVRSALAGTGVEVVHFHELCYKLGRQAGVELPPEESPGMPASYFNDELPEALARATATLDRRFDAIVVDEGQDFLEHWWIPLLDLLSDPREGVLYIFFDERQDLYGRSPTWPIKGEPFDLTVNCRNTQAIHRALRETLPEALDGVACRGPAGRPPLRLSVGQEGAATLQQALRQVLHRLVQEEGVDPASIAILTPRGRAKSALQEGMTLGNLHLTWEQPARPGTVLVSTIHAFKGLERPVIILAELEHLFRGQEDNLLYVARSRATNHLIEVWGGLQESG